MKSSSEKSGSRIGPFFQRSFQRLAEVKTRLKQIGQFGQQSLSKLDAEGRLAFSTMAAMAFFLVLPDTLHLDNRILISWIGGTLCFLTLILLVINQMTPQQIRQHVQEQESYHFTVFLLVAIVACVSVFAIGLMQSHNEGLSPTALAFKVVLSLAAVLCSWFLTHTVFALHYATCYYRPNGDTSLGFSGGVQFPDTQFPNYWDFLYFSFVLGMTFQTADVAVTSPSWRLLAIGHGLVGFFFSMVILASTVNIISGLI